MVSCGWLIRFQPGIGLFTHHKYRKSIESTVPLDAHGNPIVDEDDGLFFERENGYMQPEETIFLTSAEGGDDLSAVSARFRASYRLWTSKIDCSVHT